MASKAEEEEGKIPVFTVLKNNTILKNIFIVNKPPDPSPSPFTTSHEDVLMVGRHPDCDLILTHPSISRFHLEIRSKPSTQSLSVLDLSSVHGTWVLGRKVEPGVSVEMKEGDTLSIGVSSRVYRLHWIPISRAYDMENPFVSQLDVVPEEEQAAEQQQQQQEEEKEERKQSLKSCYPVEMEEIQSVDSVLECISSLFLNKNLDVTAENEIPAAPPTASNDENKLSDSLNQLLNVKKEIPSAPPMPEDIISVCCEEEMKSRSRDETFGVPSSDGENKLCDSINRVRSLSYVESVVECDDTWTEYLSESICLPTTEVVQETKMQQFYTPPDTFTSPVPSGLRDPFEKHWSRLLINNDPASFDEKCAAEAIIPTESEFEHTVKDNRRVTDILTAGVGVFNYENSFFLLEEVIPDSNFQQIEVVEEVAVDSLSDGLKQDPHGEEHKTKLLLHLSAKSSHEQGHSLDEIVKDIGHKCTSGICSTSLQIESMNSSPEAVSNITKENQTLQSNTEILGSCIEAMAKKSINGNIWSRRGKASSAPQIRTSKSISKSTANVDTEIAMNKKKDIISKTIPKNLFSVLDREEEDDDDDGIFTPDKENFGPNTLQLLCLKKKGKLEEIKHSKSQRSHNSKDNFSSDVYPYEVISPTSSKENQQDLFSVLDGEKEEEIFTPDKENFSPNTLQLHLLKKKGNLEEIKCSKAQWSQHSESKLSANIYPDESISSPSNKENQAPKEAQEHKSQRKPFGSFELAQWSQNSKRKFNANIYPDVGISPTSKKENPTPKVVQEHKLRRKPFGSHIELAKEQDIMALNNRVERVPFQLLMDAGGKGRSWTSCPVSAAESIDVSNCGQIIDERINPSDISWERKRSWDMVVDTATLMNKESRKALQLLQGLGGTRLIIPRLVIRELDSMKWQYSIFRRISEASLALEWIEECMVKTNWWIHIQSSMEEERLIAPTPPASPHTQFSEESWTFPVGIGSSQPSSHSSIEIASPTAEDHILDFALLYRRKHSDGQLVLFSEDVTLKIKCMAEGLLCEPVQEFCESLVNPFSERFMWTNSSPRGQTWSCQDDVVLREKYCRLPVRKSSKGAASGLKLILLHNSQYGH